MAQEVGIKEKMAYIREAGMSEEVRLLIEKGFESRYAFEYVYDACTMDSEQFVAKYIK